MVGLAIANVIIILALGYSLFSVVLGNMLAPGTFVVGETEIRETAEEKETPQLTFVGDIMLSRFVDTLSRRHGLQYSFTHLEEYIDSEILVGNFEGCLSEERHTIPGSLRFPVSYSFVPVLKKAGFTHLSLANNHAYDCGIAAVETMRADFLDSEITAFGHPTELATSSLALIDVNEVTIAIIGLHTLYAAYAPERLRTLMNVAASSSDWQIIYVHWGNEYQAAHSADQALLAKQLIDLGADLIIGHHPHVVQDIDLIDGVPVLYSLGNFVFDQYFSQAVQEGLVATLLINDDLSIRLIPVTSIGSRSSPRAMPESERVLFLENLAQRSHSALQEMISRGQIDRKELLATSSEMVIMAR